MATPLEMIAATLAALPASDHEPSEAWTTTKGVFGLRPSVAELRAALDPDVFWHAHALGWTCMALAVEPLAVFSRSQMADQVLWELTDCHWPFDPHRRWARRVVIALGDEGLHEVVLEVVRRAPEDDGVLWMIGDGEIAECEMRAGGPARLERAGATLPRLRHIRRLVVDDLYGGSPPADANRDGWT